jgi:hypothetical protein
VEKRAAVVHVFRKRLYVPHAGNTLAQKYGTAIINIGAQFGNVTESIVSAALINVKPHIWTNRVFSAFLFWR